MTNLAQTEGMGQTVNIPPILMKEKFKSKKKILLKSG